MNDLNSLLSIYNFLNEALERVNAIEHKVKHGKYKIQRKKIKDQVLDGSEPRDIEREQICKNARKKAHTNIADTKKEMSQDARDKITSCHEGLEVIDESAETISGMYGLDFMEEAVGWDVDFTFFDKPTVTPLSESLDIGTTKTGRKRKCKALGIAEGVFAPIALPGGERVFSRNHRLYESDHWDYQLENENFMNKVHTRRMLGMIGHEDKKITDKDLRDGKVSHIVTDLEVREDEEHGKYLWGRLEIINTDAGRNLKEYYEQDIPLFVSSRAGGKLLPVPGQNFKKVDKTRYFCECFDVVREPGFLGAAPVYHSISEDKEDNYSELISKLAESLDVDEAKLLKVIEQVDNRINEDKSMLKDKQNASNAESIIGQLLKPISEKISEIGSKLDALENEVSEAAEENTEAVEEKAEAVVESTEEKTEEVSEESAEEKVEDKEEVSEAEEKVEESVEEKKEAEEVSEEKKEEHDKDCTCDKCKKEADCTEKCHEEAEDTDKVTNADAAKSDLEKKERKEEAENKKAEEKVHESETTEDKVSEEAEDKVEEVSLAGVQIEELPEEKTNEAWAEKDPKETAPAKTDIPGAEDAKKDELEKKVEAEVHAQEAKDAAAINAGVEGGACVTAHESAEEKVEDKEEVSEAEEAAENASGLTQQVIDYKSLYEALKEEFDKCNQTVDELLDTIDSFGKRHKEVVQESLLTKNKLDSVQEQLEVANKSLNSYKLQEKFNVTVEKANELLSSKDYETVVEELKAAEAQKIEEEAQATAEAVSESLSEANMQKAPVSRKRKASSAFSATISESKDEEVSESVEAPKKRRAYSAFS